MKIKSVLLRWYKSFNVNYVQYADPVAGVSSRPWNNVRPKGVTGGDYPFIEIPVEGDITTIVGANESGKSHLISAIIKVLTGKGPNSEGDFSRTDLCHYASLRGKNADLWPNIGLRFEGTVEEANALVAALKCSDTARTSGGSCFITLLLAPDGDARQALLYLNDGVSPISLNAQELSSARKQLPVVKFIDSQVAIADQVSLAALLAAFGDADYTGKVIYEHGAAQQAAQFVDRMAMPQNHPLPPDQWKELNAIRGQLGKEQVCHGKGLGLELLLFRDVLGITTETLRHVAELKEKDRGYTEGIIAQWNLEIDRALNLSHYWQQDQAFTLRVCYKQGVLYFEITDKTDSLYTFRERSSGLRYFLSYYIQAKAIAASPSATGSVILMDEPDSFLSIMGQRNLLAIFESLVSPTAARHDTQLVYTTHSPFLINRNFPRRLQLVRKGDAEEGTQYIDKSRIRRYEPVRSALGVECAHTLFMGATNVLLEGPTDQYLIGELIREFVTPDNAGQFLDLNDVVFAPADSASAIEKLIAASQWGDEPIPTAVVLVDDDQAGHEVKERITTATGNRKKLVEPESVVLISDAVGRSIDGQQMVTTEDILPPRLYARAVERYIRRWYPDAFEKKGQNIHKALLAAEFGKDGVVQSAKKVFSECVFETPDRCFDKLGVLQEAVAELGDMRGDKNSSDIVAAAKDRVLKLCELLKRKIAQSERAERQRSGKAAIRRIISDFVVTHQESSYVFDLQLFLERLQKEAKFIGQDASPVDTKLSAMLERVGSLRAVKQERLVGADWQQWRGYIEATRQNPLDPAVALPSPADVPAESVVGKYVPQTPQEVVAG